jgi:hypothetical protein
MLALNKCRGPRELGLQLTLVILAFACACSRPVGLQGNANSQQPEQQSVPFQQSGNTNAGGNSGPHTGTPPADTQDDSDMAAPRGVPFKTFPSRLLSAGTLLTVRLESSLSSAKLDIGRTFIAEVDEPVAIGGSTIVSRDTAVQGRVQSARVSDVRRHTGYVRLTLESIRIEGKDVPLQTSSLFVRGTAPDASAVHFGDWSAASRLGQSHPAQSTIIRLRKGRRLTFRLTEPVDLGKDSGENPFSKSPPLGNKTQPPAE